MQAVKRANSLQDWYKLFYYSFIKKNDFFIIENLF